METLDLDADVMQRPDMPFLHSLEENKQSNDKD